MKCLEEMFTRDHNLCKSAIFLEDFLLIFSKTLQLTGMTINHEAEVKLRPHVLLVRGSQRDLGDFQDLEEYFGSGAVTW